MSQQLSPRAAQKKEFVIRFADARDLPLIARFNHRLAGSGTSFRMPQMFELPGERNHRPPGHPVHRELLLVEAGGEMRAGVLMQHGVFVVRGEERPFCWLQLPLSEGAGKDSHGVAFLSLMRKTTAFQPFCASLGVGSLDENWSRFALAMGWRTAAVPFFVYMARPSRVLRSVPYFRQRRGLRVASTAARYSGAAAAIGAGLSMWRHSRAIVSSYRWSEIGVFDGWATELAAACSGQYGAVARRDAAALNILFPPENPQYRRLRVQHRNGSDAGWMIVLDTQMKQHRYFGDLRVGTLVTGLSRPAEASAVIAAGVNYLIDRGVDLVVANWSHAAWQQGSRSNGFVRGPSNYFLFVSPGGAPLLSPDCPLEEIHVSRGDCDAPSSLMSPAATQTV
jgi:hypothetical protein